MLLTLPFDIAARVQAAPIASILVNGRRLDAFAVTDPEHLEIPVIAMSHCTTCGCKASGEIRSWIKPACPARDRRAA